MELMGKGERVGYVIYSDIYEKSNYFIPKLWIKWHGKERLIKVKTIGGNTISLTEKQLRRMNLKLSGEKIGGVFITLMIYNKPNRQNRRIPLLAISKQLQKKIGRLSINVEREFRKRPRKYPGWTST